MLHLEGAGSRRIKFDGKSLKGVHPDERSIAGQVGAVTKSQIPPVGVWQSIHGIPIPVGALGDIAGVVSRRIEIFIMDANGTPKFLFWREKWICSLDQNLSLMQSRI